MQQRRKIRYLIAFVLLTAGILVLLLCNIGIGTVKIPLKSPMLPVWAAASAA